MELLEYQAKELFRIVGIPILPSLTIQDARKIKQLQIPYPVVLKSQVRSGGRGKAGGIRFVANTIDAIAAARSIFNLSILGEYPEVILAEAHYNTERELFLAIVLDYDLKCPVLLGSARGGMNIDSLLSNLQQVAVTDEFTLFYARQLATRMGLSGNLICSVSEIMAKMYRLFKEQDLDLIEINPLGVNNKGELMALDGRIKINDHALARQPIIETLNFSSQQRASADHSVWTTNKNFSQVNWRWLDWHQKNGKIGMICSSFDSALLTWDLLDQNKVVTACGALIENSLVTEGDNLQLYREQLLSILRQLESFAEIKVIILNIWDIEAVNRQIAQTVVDYCQVLEEAAELATSKQILVDEEIDPSQSPQVSVVTHRKPYFVLRLLNHSNINDLASSEQIYLSSSLEDSIHQAIAIVKSS
ncbi:ATPase [Pleurocapsa sp. CCALA 161]|uniref:ATP-grasp domain-containing protein n=1 Tax=Pleurocapsa sp. CCALA 161 TaxID=2107688 RepID=UPI000D07B166|nr:ATP-grasp domain-containing protein [Pleurocapsa sp. CCALA 161]PSB06520.1 ATPase [Pleurocapsa sp. CCALA 161]